MRNKRASERFFLVLAALTAASVAWADEPHMWLERMNTALTTRNYDGVFSHWQGSKVETLRIIHRVKDGEVTERLLSLDGSGREFIRKGNELACYLPDKRTVLVETRPEQGLLLGGLPTFDGSQSDVYEITALKKMRHMGREARLIAVTAKDQFRYGYRLWIDESTAMPLRTQLCDSRGRVIEQVVFASLTLPSHIPDSAFKPDISTEGFQFLRNDGAPALANNASAPVMWSALKLPPGFRMSARGAQMMPGATDPVAHLVFTDGIASVSVFVESRQRSSVERPPNSSTARVGSASAFSTMVDGHQVTAVGEVPPETVQFIARSVKAQSQDTSTTTTQGLGLQPSGGSTLSVPGSSTQRPAAISTPAPTGPMQGPGPPRR
jgi:sigma-E factor negative regulatory protein RseB